MADNKQTLEVAFATGLPMGTRGVFKYNGVVWIARTAARDQGMFVLLDRYAGIFKRINNEMVSWINRRPGDTELVTGVLELITGAEELRRELMQEKMETARS